MVTKNQSEPLSENSKARKVKINARCKNGHEWRGEAIFWAGERWWTFEEEGKCPECKNKSEIGAAFYPNRYKGGNRP